MWNKDTHLEETKFQINLRKIIIICSVIFILIFSKLFYLQILKRNYFKIVSNENREYTYRYRAPRGKIISNDGKLLVDNRPSYSIILSRFDNDTSILKGSLLKLEKLLNINLESLMKKLEDLKYKPFEIFYIVRDIPRETMFEVKEKKPYLPGINIITEPFRRYWLGFPSSHLLGYISEINSRELRLLNAEGYRRGDYIGKMGIEKVYDKYLRGKSGFKRIEVDASGKQKKVIEEVLYKPGNDVYLTIDSKLQKTAEDLLEDKFGAIIALDPKSGRILALASNPGFDPMQFLDPMSEELDIILHDPKYPLMNRAIQSQYEPASVYKIITTIAGLEEDILHTDDKIKCNGKFFLGRKGKLFRCWKREGHGTLDLHRAFAKSCDVYYYNMGLKIGVDNLVKYSKLLGLGAYTEIDLPSEKKGLLPGVLWKKERLGKHWYRGDTVNMSIGQGYLLVTPIQLTNLIATIINGGYLYRPYVLDRVVSPDNKILLANKPIFNKKISISQSTIDFIKNAMEEVVVSGTGVACRIRGINIGGKTGTAENPHGEDHAWFVCFAPLDLPKIVLCVFMENGGHGGSVAAPLARKMLETYFN